MLTITSAQNTQYKQWKKLLSRKGRKAFNQFIIEGEHLIQMALEQQTFRIEALLVKQEEVHPLLEQASAQDIKVFHLDKGLFQELMTTQTPQDIAAVVHMPEFPAPGEMLSEWRKILLIDRVQDPGNLGTIIRTADAAGIDAIVCQPGTVDLFNDKTVRSTQGSLFHLPIYYLELTHLLEQLQQHGWFVIGTSLHQAVEHYDLTLPSSRPGVALIVGNEGEGVAQPLLEKTDINIKIPIFGQAESLNVAIATGIVLYEIVKKYEAER